MKAEYVKCYTGNLDGKRVGLVVAANQKEAAQIAGTSLYDFRQYWSAANHPWPVQAPKLRTLYTRSFSRGGEWVEGRVPHRSASANRVGGCSASQPVIADSLHAAGCAAWWIVGWCRAAADISQEIKNIWPRGTPEAMRLKARREKIYARREIAEQRERHIDEVERLRK